MYVVAFVTHKPGQVEAGSEIQGAFIDYLRDHPIIPTLSFTTPARPSPMTRSPSSACS